MPNSTEPTLTIVARDALPALPAKRARRRTTRGSHAWRFRRPPSRKRVEVAAARGLPEPAAMPPVLSAPSAEH